MHAFYNVHYEKKEEKKITICLVQANRSKILASGIHRYMTDSKMLEFSFNTCLPFIATVLPAPTQRHDFLDEVNMPPTLTTYSTRLRKGKTTPKQRGRVSQGRPAPLTTAALRYTALCGLRLSPNSCRACRLRTQPVEPNTGQDEDVRRAGTRCRISAGKVLATGQTVTERAPAGTHGTQGSTKAGPVLTARSCTSFSSKEYCSATIQSF